MVCERSVIRSLGIAETELNSMSSLNIPDHIRDTAMKIFTDAVNRGWIAGRSAISMISASLWRAYRLHGHKNSLRDIVKASHATKSMISSCYKVIDRESDFTLDNHINPDKKTKIDLFWIGKHPSVRPAVEEYLEKRINKENSNQSETARKYGLSPTTVTKTIKQLANKNLYNLYMKDGKWCSKDFEHHPWIHSYYRVPIKLEDSEEDYNKRMKLYKLGLDDREIGERLNLARSTIQMWRNRNELPPPKFFQSMNLVEVSE